MGQGYVIVVNRYDKNLYLNFCAVFLNLMYIIINGTLLTPLKCHQDLVL